MENKRKVSVLLSEEEFLALENLCKRNGYKKSSLIARLIREFIKDKNIDQSKRSHKG